VDEERKGEIVVSNDVFIVCYGHFLFIRLKRLFNFYLNSKMPFWSETTAAPSFYMTLPFYSRKPEYLRKDKPPLLPETITLTNGRNATVRRLFTNDIPILVKFLETYYGGEDWKLAKISSWIGIYLRNIDILALGLFEDQELLATIFSVPVANDESLFSHGGSIKQLRIIEGLCVAPSLRGHGIAGFMIKHADAFTSYRFGVCAHVWAREENTKSLFSTAIASHTYGYKICSGVESTSGTYPGLQTMDWRCFEHVWVTQCRNWVHAGSDCMVVTRPSNLRGGLHVFYMNDCLVVVSDTQRRVSSGAAIYEIVWSGKYAKGVLMPASDDLNFKQLLNAITCILPADSLLFATTSSDCGGLRADWSDGWTIGRSGVHSLYIYNYMPPVFGNCRIHMIREEL
jgi:hypothetical protein